MKNWILLLILSSLLFNISPSQLIYEPDEEVRAVWLTTFAGLDWPGSYSKEEQKKSLLEIVERLYAARFNTIIFQVRSRGDAFYNSSFEPWARELTGILGMDPGWDPLAFLIEAAHERGMEVHAWLNVYKVWGSAPLPLYANPPHILSSWPDWGREYENEIWLDPGIPGVNEFILGVALDLVEKYPVDAIHFDHIRYPGRDFDDFETYELYGDGLELAEWRRENINSFVRGFYKFATAIRPGLKVGSAPIGVYQPIPGYRGSTAFHDYYQDPVLWLREGVHDYIAPQIYWDIAFNPKFDNILSDWMRRSHGRHVYGGIGIFKPTIEREVALQVSIVRALRTPGHAYFRYSHLGRILEPDAIYGNHVNIPRMEWKSNPYNLIDGDHETLLDTITQLLGREVVFHSDFHPYLENELKMSFYLPEDAPVSVYIVDRDFDFRSRVYEGHLEAGVHTLQITSPPYYENIISLLKVGERTTERMIRKPR